MFLLLNQPLLLLYFTVTKVNKNQYKKQLTLSSPKDVPYVHNNFGVQRQRSPTYKEKWSSNYPPIMKWNRTLLMWWTCTHGVITLIERPTTSHALLMSSESHRTKPVGPSGLKSGFEYMCIFKCLQFSWGIGEYFICHCVA